MRLSVRHPLSNKRHNLDFSGYVWVQPEGWKKEGVGSTQSSTIVLCYVFGRLLNWIRLQEKRPHRKTILLHLISTLQVSFSISCDNAFILKTRKVAIQISMLSPPSRECHANQIPVSSQSDCCLLVSWVNIDILCIILCLTMNQKVLLLLERKLLLIEVFIVLVICVC